MYNYRNTKFPGTSIYVFLKSLTTTQSKCNLINHTKNHTLFGDRVFFTTTEILKLEYTYYFYTPNQCSTVIFMAVKTLIYQYQWFYSNQYAIDQLKIRDFGFIFHLILSTPSTTNVTNPASLLIFTIIFGFWDMVSTHYSYQYCLVWSMYCSNSSFYPSLNFEFEIRIRVF